ncbi:helix-turn-helix transcriptional regulator [Clostridium tertium]|uniref:helix-turn-helix transcriptional regulator n=1 Tax=Clostridium tertium TaxID=1559 RepID=UPI002A809778|nr:helix-turn-helix transcriptional regulator [Clostridium tertium]MDY4604312.1 helix-turn-helix transcriptional regulator [Clostridium tertium]
MNRKIKIARIQKNMTQKELCHVVGIGTNTLVKLEKGDYSTLKYPVMLKLSSALGKTPKELFFSEEE